MNTANTLTELVMHWQVDCPTMVSEKTIAIFDAPVTVEDLQKHFIKADEDDEVVTDTEEKEFFAWLLDGNFVMFDTPNGEVQFQLREIDRELLH